MLPTHSKEEPYQAAIASFFADLKIGITSLANIFDPDVILMGGGLFTGMSPYLGEVQTWVREHAFPAVSKRVELLPTKFGNQSGAIGAALIARESTL